MPKENILGEPGFGFVQLMDELPQERLSIAVSAISAAEAALNEVSERKRLQDANRSFAETLLTSGPAELKALDESLVRANQRLNGFIPQAGANERKKFFELLKSTGSVRQAQQGVISFSGLLDALDPQATEAEPRRWLAPIQQRYRVALIDEFQDTDPLQWRLLQACFATPNHLLLMVGDPKQAIYRFRGGDLNTYKQARQRADFRGQRFGSLDLR